MMVRSSNARPISVTKATTYHSSLMKGVLRSAIWRMARCDARSSEVCGKLIEPPYIPVPAIVMRQSIKSISPTVCPLIGGQGR